MKRILQKTFLTFLVFASTSYGWATNHSIKPQKIDIIIAEQIAKLMIQIGKNEVKSDFVEKLSREIGKSKNFQPFSSWSSAIQKISKEKTSKDLIIYCKQFNHQATLFPLEKILDRIAGNFCREKSLILIQKDIEKNQSISDDAIQFIEENLKYYLTKKNKKHFAEFIQKQSTYPEVLKKLSQDITTYSVQHEIVPSQEVLKDILINEEITKLIQDKGYNLVQNKNVFYGEFGKLIEQSYKSLDTNPDQAKVKEQLGYLKNYLELNQDHLPLSLCLTRLNDFAKAVFRAKFDELSRDVLRYVIKKNNKEIQEDALYFYLWTYIVQNNYKEALQQAKKHDLTSSKTKIADPRLKYWVGYILEQVGETKESHRFYESIVNESPLSFYAIMSVKKLQIMKPESIASQYYQQMIQQNHDTHLLNLQQLDADYLSSLIRLKTWATIDSQKLMRLELKRLRLHSIPNYVVNQPTEKQPGIKSELHLLNAQIMIESKNYLPTFKYLYEALDKKDVTFSKSLLQVLYPNAFLKELTPIVKRHQLDPLVVLSLIRQESVFNPLAKSPVGARGLMQIMPMTAKRIRRGARDKHLVTPQTNMEIGTTYFKGLMKRYDENLVYVLAAYNAGEGRVDRWKGSLFDADQSILRNIESIPFLETRNYVKLIFRNIFFYKLLQTTNNYSDPIDHNVIFDVKLGFKQ